MIRFNNIHDACILVGPRSLPYRLITIYMMLKQDTPEHITVVVIIPKCGILDPSIKLLSHLFCTYNESVEK